jgi:hypothetical protein
MILKPILYFCFSAGRRTLYNLYMYRINSLLKQVYPLQYLKNNVCLSDYISCKSCQMNYSKFDFGSIFLHTRTCSLMKRPTAAHNFICLICDYHTQINQHMKRHIRKHTGKPYKCRYCDFRASRRDNATLHMKIKHGDIWASCRNVFEV